MFGLNFTTVGLALVLAFGSGLGAGYKATRSHYEHVAEKAAAAQREAIDKANVNAEAAAELYEAAKAKQSVRVVTVTREVSHALETAPAWRDEPVPDLVRQSIATASAALDPAEPDSAVPVPAAGGADKWSLGARLRLGAGKPSRLLGEAPSP